MEWCHGCCWACHGAGWSSAPLCRYAYSTVNCLSSLDFEFSSERISNVIDSSFVQLHCLCSDPDQMLGSSAERCSELTRPACWPALSGFDLNRMT